MSYERINGFQWGALCGCCAILAIWFACDGSYFMACFNAVGFCFAAICNYSFGKRLSDAEGSK